MDTLKKNHSTIKSNSRKTAHLGEAASELLNESKKYANGLYEQGLNKVSNVEDNMKEYSDELLRKVQDNPLTSILIAGGIGFLLSAFLKKS